MKKTIVLLLIVSIFCLSLFNAFSPLTAHATSSAVYETGFENDANDWFALVGSGNIERTIEERYDGEYSLKMAAHELTYMSPALNIYPLLKANGSGTYHFSMRVLYTGTADSEPHNTFMMLRGASNLDKNSFIVRDSASGSYFKRISTAQKLNEHKWKLITGSVKVLDSDLKKDSNEGNVFLCIDGLPDSSNITIYIDSVKITKLSNTGITNGSFSSGITGWRTWNEDEVFKDHLTTDSLFGNSLWRYLKVNTYGSIATNVDQILSYYGPGDYTLSFKMKVDQLSNYNQPFTFYFTTNFSEYHKWIGQYRFTHESSWVTLTYNISISNYEFKNQLLPDEKEIHFRIQSPDNGIVTYYLDDVSLTPIANTRFGITVNTYVNTANGAIAKCETNTLVPLNAQSRATWTSSDPSIAIIDQFGYIYAFRSGTITITATSRTGNYSTSTTYNVEMPSYEIAFDNYKLGQEQAHQCWAACTKMLTLHYLDKNELSTTRTDGTLANNITSAGLTANDYGSYTDCTSLFSYYTADLSIGNIYRQDLNPPTAEKLKNALYSNIPIVANCTDDSITGHSVVVYGFYYNNNDELILKIYDPASLSNTGGNKEWKFNAMINGGVGSEGYIWYSSYYINEERIEL